MRIYCLMFLVLIGISSCDLSTDETTSAQYQIPVSYVTMPEYAMVGDTVVANVSYVRPNDCYIFNGFEESLDYYTWTIAVKNVVFDDGSGCTSGTSTVFEVPYEFFPAVAGDYEFKFWKGTTAEGDQFITKHITVTNQ